MVTLMESVVEIYGLGPSLHPELVKVNTSRGTEGGLATRVCEGC